MIEVRTFIVTIVVILVIAAIFYNTLIREVEDREELVDEMMWILIQKLSKHEPVDTDEIYQQALERVHRKRK